MTLRRRLAAVYDAALSADHEHFDRAFTILLLAIIGVLLVDTVQYRPDSQLFPLVIGVPTFGLLAFLLAMQFSPKLQSFAERHAATDVFNLDEVVSDFEETGGGGRIHRPLPEERLSVVSISAWTLALFLTIILVGFLPGILVFMLAFYRVHADQSWTRTVLFSVVTWAFIVLIFEMVLNTPFYTGVFEIEVPLPT